jgi:uncharacterized protein YbjT (DUF2867 family)
MIVVTGVSGRVGGRVAAELARRGVPFRAVTRDAGRVPDLGGTEIALTGYDRPDTLGDALEPGDRVFMVSMHEPPDRRLPLHRGFVEVATQQQVGRIVYLSFLGADAGITYYDGVARHEAGIVADDYRALTGKDPLTVREIVELHRDEMPLASRSVATSPRCGKG